MTPQSLPGFAQRSAYIDPASGEPLEDKGGFLTTASGRTVPIRGDIPRFVDSAGIAENWSRQWRIWQDLHYSEQYRSRSYEQFKAKFGIDPSDRSLKPMRVLDAGCGNGRNTALFESSQHQVWSVDMSLAVEFAKANVPPGAAEFAQANIANLPFPDHFFDFVFSDGVLIHVPDVDLCIGHLLRKLRPGGLLGLAMAKEWDPAEKFAIAHERVIDFYRRFSVGLPEFILNPFVALLSSLYRLRSFPIVGRLALLLVPEWHDDPEWRRCYIHDYLTAVIRKRQRESDITQILEKHGARDIVVFPSHEIRVTAKKA